MRETLEVLEPHASELAFELRFEAAPELPAVAFDRDALSQVLFNLVDKALKHSSDAQDRFVSIAASAKVKAWCCAWLTEGQASRPSSSGSFGSPSIAASAS